MKYLRIAVAVMPWLLSCGFGDSDSVKQTSNLEMIDVDVSADLGWLGDSARTRMTYPFALSRHEVTQRLFLKYMGYLPAMTAQQAGNDKPAVMVSWYEAILFANKLSKAEGLDTVYSYSTAVLGSTEKAATVEGLVMDYAVDGYRLPTEAEWEFVARSSKGLKYPWGMTPDSSLAGNYAWYAANSGGLLQNVCTVPSKQRTFCDLSGNAMEWVDGWYGAIPRDTLSNYIGPLLPNSSQQRIVKGGSFRHSLAELALTRRMDVYGTFGNTRTEYIGFRLARGAVQNPSFSSDNGVIGIKGSPAKLVATKSQISSFIGVTNARVALVNGTNDQLVTMNLSQNPLQLLESPLQSLPRHPDFSPNGNWIAYGTRSEGQQGSSELWVKEFQGGAESRLGSYMGYIPRWIVDSASGDTSLVYSDDALANRDSIAWISGKTFRVAMQGNIANGVPKLIAEGSFHDGLSGSGNVLVTGYTELRVLEIAEKRLRTLFRSPHNGKDAGASSQVCNVSLHPGNGGEIAFLDFGYEGKSSLVGKSYGSHEYIFFMDIASGSVIDTIRVPSPWLAWDHVEWSNHPDFLIATVKDADDLHRAVYLVRKSDHSTLKIMEGEDLWTPALWIAEGIQTDLSLDSLFHYQDPSGNESYQSQLIRFWKNRNTASGYAIGSSRTLHGVNPTFLSKPGILNLGVISADFWLLRDLWKHYIKPHASVVNTLILEMSYDFFCYVPGDWYDVNYGLTLGHVYDSLQGYWINGLPAEFDVVLADAALDPWKTVLKPTGYFPRVSEGFGVEPLAFTTSTGYLAKPEAWRLTMDSLVAMIQDMGSMGIQVIGITFPQNPLYRQMDVYGRYGPGLETAKQIQDELLSRTQDLPYFKLLDENRFGLHDYTDLDAADYDHLSNTGAMKLTLRLDSLIRNW